MVAHYDDGWCCTGWLDWEFAIAGDADFDLTRAARSRLVELGEMPMAFYDGYGRTPHPTREALYELVYFLHMAKDSQYHVDRATYRYAWTYINCLPSRLEELEALLEL